MTTFQAFCVTQCWLRVQVFAGRGVPRAHRREEKLPADGDKHPAVLGQRKGLLSIIYLPKPNLKCDFLFIFTLYLSYNDYSHEYLPFMPLFFNKDYFEPVVLLISLSQLHLLAFILTFFFRQFPLFAAPGAPLLHISLTPWHPFTQWMWLETLAVQQPANSLPFSTPVCCMRNLANVHSLDKMASQLLEEKGTGEKEEEDDNKQVM